MKKIILQFALLFSLTQVSFSQSNNTSMCTFIDKGEDRNILVWNSETGKSTLYAYYEHKTDGLGFHKLLKQLPPKHFNSGTTQMSAFIDGEGDKNILVWNPETGKSILYAYYEHKTDGLGYHKFGKQLPPKHFNSGTTQMSVFLDKDGDRNILVWNPETGKSILYAYYIHETNGSGFHKFNNQLPQE